jgi:DNA repair protein RecN (Recombination protein N)
MIKYLSIKNLLLIDQIDIELNNGLCVLTGETGAGKSMILDSLGLISGERLKSSFKPKDGRVSSVTAIIDISNHISIKKQIIELGIDCENEIILKRIINNDGKSKAFINDNIVSLNILKNISNKLLEIHSQFSEQGLLDSSTHIDILDEYGDYRDALDTTKKEWKKLKKVKKEFEDKKYELEKISNEKEKIEYDLNEIRNLDPQMNEYEELIKKKTLLKNSAKISEGLNKIVENFFSDTPPGIDRLLAQNISKLDKIKDLLDEETQKKVDNLNSIYIDTQEIANYFSSILNEEFDLKSLEKIEDRIEDYRRISKKHRIAENSLIEFREILNSKLDGTYLENKNLEILESQYKKIEETYQKESHKLSNFRKQSSRELDNLINKELPELKLENARFETSFEKDIPTENGYDKVTFKIKTNPNSEMGSIKNVSSGGELCRIALAIKVIAQKNSKTTMVFDEVDSGIGGAVSTAVGERLKKLGNAKQVIVVTHSPQVAAFGNDHFIVYKTVNNNESTINLKQLDKDQKINEIARMLSGKETTSEAINAAKKLINE